MDAEKTIHTKISGFTLLVRKRREEKQKTFYLTSVTNIYLLIVQAKAMDFAINYAKRLSEIIKPPDLNY